MKPDLPALVARYRDGERAKDLCAEVGISRDVFFREVRFVTDEAGYDVRQDYRENRHKHWKPLDLDAVRTALASGKDIYDIARPLGMKVSTLRRRLREDEDGPQISAEERRRRQQESLADLDERTRTWVEQNPGRFVEDALADIARTRSETAHLKRHLYDLGVTRRPA